MSLAGLVNKILGRDMVDEGGTVSEPIRRPQIYHASSQGKSHVKAEQKLIGALPAPLGSDVYVKTPEIDIHRVGKNDWRGTASYQLKDGYQPPTPVQANPAIESGGLASKVTATTQQQATTPPPAQPQAYKAEPKHANRSPRNQARAVPARAPGYTPSALEQQLQQRRYS